MPPHPFPGLENEGMADLGNLGSTLRLQCNPCGWVLPDEMKMEAALLHFQVEHDTDEVKLDLAGACSCGAAMTYVQSRPTGGGFKDYMKCDACGNTGFVRRAA